MILLYYDIIVLWYCFMIAWSHKIRNVCFLSKKARVVMGGREAVIKSECTPLFRWCSPLLIVYNNYYNFEHFPE